MKLSKWTRKFGWNSQKFGVLTEVSMKQVARLIGMFYVKKILYSNLYILDG